MSEARGYSDGIWILWNRIDLQITSILMHDQYIHVEVKEALDATWLLTAVYASPRDNERQVMCEAIENLSHSISESWMLISDFNEIACSNEKKGCAPVNINRCHIFHNWINRCHLLDLGCICSRFTWRGPLWNGRDGVFKRLDRAQTLLSKPFLGCILIITRLEFFFNPTESPQQCRPFRFLAAWLEHEDFDRLLSTNWKNEIYLTGNLFELTTKLKEWNQNVFGNIFKRKQELMARLKGVHESPGYGSNLHLDFLEANLTGRLEKALHLEETLWLRKSRKVWIRDSDRNTRYYHAKTILRRRKNKILELRSSGGDWVTDQQQLKGMTIDFYKLLFLEDNLSRPNIVSTNRFSPLQEVDITRLEAIVTNT